ncbi:MAG: DUF2309 domain-containing protein [Candidatus Obscuribacterales bacterium]|nr:DUF2309 domain-containing protein [Candidatus Obscuribacterales bacterium]
MTITKSEKECVSSITEIRELVHRASLVLAHYWPMTTFVHHNPIRSLETLPFHEAIRFARRFNGGRGYLPNEQYRQLVRTGRISYEHLDAAIYSVARSEFVEIAGRKVSHFDVLRAHMLVGITAPSDDMVAALVERASISEEVLTLVHGAMKKAAPTLRLRLSSPHIRELAKRLDPRPEPPSESSTIGTEVTLLRWCDRQLHTQLEWLVNTEMIKWCQSFLEEGKSPWPMPYREKGFYETWKTLAALEWSPCGISNSGKKVRALPASADEAVLAHLDALAIPQELRQDYLSLALASLSGWASFINWRSERSTYEWQAAYPIDLVQYLAVRLFYERELVDKTCRDRLGIEGNFKAVVSHVQATIKPNSTEIGRLASAWRLTMLGSALGFSQQELQSAEAGLLNRLLEWMDEFPESEHGKVWLNAYESGFHEKFIKSLRDSVFKLERDNTEVVRPLAQAMFCIDVRSEPFRRHLEAVGRYETIGFAGFFGIPIRCRALDQHHETDQVPAIVQPKYTVHEVVREDQKYQAVRHNGGVRVLYAIKEMLDDMKYHVLTPYIMVESIGWFFGVQLFGRTLFPEAYRKWQNRIKKAIVPPVGTQMTVDRDRDDLGLTREEQCATIETVLKMMGLTKNFARLVLVCGHTSTSDNNPYEAALNCGACGGNSGKPNARLLAAMANRPYVREHLARNGIVVPEDTHFVGAVHDTTTDAIELFDIEDLPNTHKQDLERLEQNLKEAALRTNQERCTRLPGAAKDPSDAAKEVGRRAGDWSETRPEWGLAGNAAFIIGSRELTKDLNLEGRVFLNSHDYRLDSTGALLEGIMMGPMVVGQWINAEHYFSATDTEVYGSGSKIYHNVVGRIGIMSGPQSDLRSGLAWQSMMNGEIPYHEPLRLFVVIEAPRERISKIVERQPVLKQLCDNEWIHLMAIDHESDEKLFRYEPGRGWTDSLGISETDVASGEGYGNGSKLDSRLHLESVN